MRATSAHLVAAWPRQITIALHTSPQTNVRTHEHTRADENTICTRPQQQHTRTYTYTMWTASAMVLFPRDGGGPPRLGERTQMNSGLDPDERPDGGFHASLEARGDTTVARVPRRNTRQSTHTHRREPRRRHARWRTHSHSRDATTTQTNKSTKTKHKQPGLPTMFFFGDEQAFSGVFF